MTSSLKEIQRMYPGSFIGSGSKNAGFLWLDLSCCTLPENNNRNKRNSPMMIIRWYEENNESLK